MSSRAGFNRVRFADRLLAEAVAAGERRDGRALRDATAEQAAMAAEPDFETRLVARAEALPDADKRQDATRRVRTVVTVVIAVALIFGALAGAASGRAALSSPREPVNFFLVLLGLLGVQTLLLVMWFVVFVVGPRLLRRGSLGGLLVSAAQAMAQRFLPRKDHLDAIEAFGRLALRGRAGAWLLSSVSHQMWAMFNIGCLLMIIVLLSTNQYNFVWETTTRTEEQYITLTRSIAAWPDRLGFTAPTDEQIRASRHVKNETASLGNGPASEPLSGAQRDRQIAWSGLLIGCMVTYGLLPRLMLSMVCVTGGWFARRRVRLDLEAPEFAVLRPILLPAARSHGEPAETSENHADSTPSAVEEVPDVEDRRPIGDPAIVGLEIDRPACSWPPVVHGLNWDDAGIIDTGNDRNNLLDRLRTSHTRPRTLAVVCDLPATPDRGVQAFLRELRQAAGAPLTFILTGGHRLRSRAEPDALTQRINDWHQAALHAGVSSERIHDIDFDHLTDRTIAQLRATVMNNQPTEKRTESRLNEAFAAIASHAERWPDDPSHDDILQLHRDIASLYRTPLAAGARLAGGLGKLVRDVREDGRDITANMQRGARSMIEQLPAQLRSQPKWLAAGAAAGAFGCLALTLSIAPAAIGALPAWAALGAAVSGGIRMAFPQGNNEVSVVPEEVTARPIAVRAAALFAAVLDLQGRPESEITRIIEAAFAESGDEVTQPIDAASTRAWLNDVSLRFTRAAGVPAP